MLQTVHHFHGPLLDSLRYAGVSLLRRSPELRAVLQVWPHQCFVERKDHLCWPAGSIFISFFISVAAQNTVSLLSHKGTLLTHIQIGVHLSPRSLSAKLLSRWMTPKWALGGSSPGAELWTSRCWTSWGSCQPISFQSSQILLDGSTTFLRISHASLF